jgi:hypothetical protein
MWRPTREMPSPLSLSYCMNALTLDYMNQSRGGWASGRMREMYRCRLWSCGRSYFMVQMAGPSVWDERLAANDPTLFLQHITRNKIGKLDAAYCGILLSRGR